MRSKTINDEVGDDEVSRRKWVEESWRQWEMKWETDGNERQWEMRFKVE